MKIAEKNEMDGTVLHTVETHDAEPSLRRIEGLREMHEAGAGFDRREYKHVGSIPGFVAEVWCREAGVSMNDHEAFKELLKRKMADGEFSKLRVWNGSL